MRLFLNLTQKDDVDKKKSHRISSKWLTSKSTLNNSHLITVKGWPLTQQYIRVYIIWFETTNQIRIPYEALYDHPHQHHWSPHKTLNKNSKKSRGKNIRKSLKNVWTKTLLVGWKLRNFLAKKGVGICRWLNNPCSSWTCQVQLRLGRLRSPRMAPFEQVPRKGWSRHHHLLTLEIL